MGVGEARRPVDLAHPGAEDSQWMQQALALAWEAANDGEVPVGAIVVDGAGGLLLGQGRNNPIGRRDPTAHAEILALREAAAKIGNYRLPGAVLYVTLEPCMMCVGALVHARVKRLVFGAPEPRTGAVVSREQGLASSAHNHRVAVTAGVLQDECAALLQKFFRERRS